MKKIIFFVSCFFVMMNTSLAITMSCSEVASPGEVIKVHVEEDEFNGIKVKYKFDSGFIYQDMSLNSSWKSYYDGVDGFSVGNVTNQDKLLMDINVKVGMDTQINKDYTLELVEIEGNNSEYKSVDLESVSCKVKLLSDVNTLDSLVVDNVNLSPKFDKNVTSYKGTTKNERIVIKVSASDSEAKVEGDIGEVSLNVGVNTLVVKVTSPRGNVREYKIYITRAVDKKSSDVTLKSLTLSEGKIDFEKNNFLYSVDVNYEVESIDVEAIANDSKAKVEIQKPDKLVVGENNISIVVTAEDGTKATYAVIVNRMDKLSSDATIKDLKIKNYDINFKVDVYEYDLKIDNEDRLDIEVTLNDDKAKYVINGNKDLKNNSVIKIEVTAEDGSNNSYRIKIKKDSESNSSAINNYIGIVRLVGFIVLIIVVLVVKVFRSGLLKN